MHNVEKTLKKTQYCYIQHCQAVLWERSTVSTAMTDGKLM